MIKTFFVFLAKILNATTCFLLGIFGLSEINCKKQWRAKINTAFENGLGDIIKKKVPMDLPHYEVYDNGIIFPKTNVPGESWLLYFSSLGYENIPATQADIVCEWIQYNLVSNPDNYYISSITEEWEECTDVTPTTYTTTKDYAGNYVTTYSEGRANYSTRTKIIGYKLVKRRVSTPQKQLSKW